MDTIEMDIEEIDKTKKEAFFQTPLWYLENAQWGWIKASTPSILKRALYSPRTPFGIGKVIELSLYPNTTAIYSLILPENKSDLKPGIFINEDITEVATYGNRVMLTLKDSTSPKPEEIEVHLRSFLNLYTVALGLDILMSELDLAPGELLSYTENLTFEKGIQIEALSH